MSVAGAVSMNITFLSPLFPTDYKRQSLPFSYVDVTVSSADGSSHDVQLYTDITARKITLLSDLYPSRFSVSLLLLAETYLYLSFQAPLSDHIAQSSLLRMGVCGR